MKYGKGILIKLDEGDQETRTVRTCVVPDGSLFLLEIVRPIVETEEEAHDATCRCCKIIDGKLHTTVHLSPEAFYAVLQAAMGLATRIAESPEESKFTADAPE